MEVLRCFIYMYILMSLKSQFIVGYTKDCDCTGTIRMVNSVRNILLKDMFDMKLQNDMLTSKIDRLEQMFQEQFPLSVLSAPQDKSQTEGVDFKGIAPDTDIEQAKEVPESDLKQDNLLKAFQSEKKQRLLMESAVRYELRSLNDSFNEFKTLMDAAFSKSINIMTEKITNFEQNVTDSLSDFKTECKSSINDVRKLVTGVIETNLTYQQNVLHSCIKDVSRLDMEVSTVIDTALLNKTFLCEPNCSNGGVCFKDNTCRCQSFTTGTRCENFLCEPNCSNRGVCFKDNTCRCQSFTTGTRCENYVCDDSCAENEGECIGPGSCECPDHRYGVVCELGEANITGVYVDGSPGSRLEYESSPVSFRIRFSLSIQFNTWDENGVIFYCADRRHNEHISIIMKKGRIQCSFNCNTGTGIMTFPQKLNDGNWHKLIFWRNMRSGSLKVDDSVPLSWESPGRARSLNIHAPFYFGGVNQSQLSDLAVINLDGVRKSFEGCLANIKAGIKDEKHALSFGVPTKKIRTKRCRDILQP